MNASFLPRPIVGVAVLILWHLGVSAAPEIRSIQVDPDPLRQGAPFSVRVEGSDIGAVTGFLDFRPTLTRLIRILFAEDGGTWTASASVPADLGLQHEITATLNLVVSSATGERVSRTTKVRIALAGGGTPPEVTIESPSNGAVFTASPITVSGSASANATEVSVNGVLANLAGDGTWTATVPIPEGLTTLTAAAREAGGNTGTDSIQVRLDTLAPTLALVNPPDGGVANTRTPTLQVTYADAGTGIDTSSVHLSLNGVDVTASSMITDTGISYTPASPLPAGDNQVTAQVSDRVGHLASGAFRFSVAVFRAIADCGPTNGAAPLTVTFRTRGEFTGGSIVRYRWDFQNDGVFDTTDSVARDLTFTYTQPGTYEAILEVLNNLGETATDRCAITVAGSPPQAFVDLRPSNGPVPLNVHFVGYGTKPGGSIQKIEIDFDGDGIFDTTVQPSFVAKPDAIRVFINHADCHLYYYGARGAFAFSLNGQSLGTSPTQTDCVCNSTEPMYEINDPALLDAWVEDAPNLFTVSWQGYPELYVGHIRVELVYGGLPVSYCLLDRFGGNCAARDICGTTLEDEPFMVSTDFISGETLNFDIEHTYTAEGNYPAVIRVTDNEGLTATASALATVIRARPPGSPSVDATATPASGFAPLNVSFSGSAVDDGTIVLWEWDFDGDGVYDYSSPTSATTSHTYTVAGAFGATLRVTDNDGLASSETVEIDVDMTASLSIPSDTFTPSLGEQVTIRTSISAETDVRLYLKDGTGAVVRDLVNAHRPAGSYDDSWDGLSNGALPLPHGPYYAVLQYRAGASLRVLDLTASTGGQRYNPPRNTLPNRFQPYQDNHLTINFSVPSSQGASEIQAFIGLFNTDTRFVTLLERVPFGVGNYTIRWDGLDPNGNFAMPPPGDAFLFGIWGFRMPDNTVFLVAAPTISNVTVDPNFFDPSSVTETGEARAVVSFDLDKTASVELTVTRLDNGLVLRRIRRDNVAPGSAIQIEWDGRADNGVLVDKGDYRLALLATDAVGSQSIVRYALMRLFY